VLLPQLEAGAATSYWLATSRPGGRPHLAGVGAMWFEDKLYIVSGPGTRKSRNLAGNPNCAVSVSLPGLDLVIEGSAAKVTDAATLTRLAQLYAAQGWPATVSGDALTAPYSAPSAGPPALGPLRGHAATAFGVASAEPYGATRWRFGAS
jgi:hypothetical protein